MTRRVAIWLLKLAISIALLVIVLRRVPLDDIATSLRAAAPGLVGIGLALTAVVLVLSAWQMQVLLRATGTALALRRVLWVNLTTEFYATVLPGYLAAGALRWYRFSKAGSPAMPTLAVIGVNRFLEIGLLALMGAVFWLGSEARVLWPAMGWVMVAIFVPSLAVVAVVLNARTAAVLRRWLGPGRPWRRGNALRGWLLQLTHATRRMDARTIAAVVAMATVRCLVGALFFLVFARSLGLDISFAVSGLARSALLLLLMLPLTLAGLGLREGGLLVMLSHFGVPEGAAVALSFLLLGRDLLVKLVGGALEARDWLVRRRPEARA